MRLFGFAMLFGIVVVGCGGPSKAECDALLGAMDSADQDNAGLASSQDLDGIANTIDNGVARVNAVAVKNEKLRAAQQTYATRLKRVAEKEREKKTKPFKPGDVEAVQIESLIADARTAHMDAMFVCKGK